MAPKSAASCRSALQGLADGRLATWTGLQDCTAADAEAALGPSVPGPALADAWGAARRHPGGAGTPYGVHLWLRGDRVYAVEVTGPRLSEPLAGVLGEPEARLDSGLSSDWQQWVYSSRGLTAHVVRRTGEPKTLFGYRPMTIVEFAGSEIARVRNVEIPLE